MEVIPVIDLMGGVVVHARRGERSAYQPIRSKLAEGSGPLAIVTALMRLAPFRKFYVADLDAIRGRGGHDRALAALVAAFPDVEFWVDRGEANVAVDDDEPPAEGVPVIGSESFEDLRTLRHALKATGGVLSLDHDADGPIGPADAHRDPSIWPRRVIVMTLARVGADQGPDFDRLAEVLALAGGREIYAAGGVRGVEDLKRLAAAGASGALVASALHDGRLTADALIGL